ncbi:MAG: hypothetical protein LIO76_00720 [Clostridiales bacterium]|nr:hypothetical protein [Clostridiales bacterium]
MSYDLCLLRQANQPYYIENIRTGIYSLEELCFYLYNNICLIDESILNEKLCDWIRDELHLNRLYRQLYDQLQKMEESSRKNQTAQRGAHEDKSFPQSLAASFVLPIFREAGYLTSAQMHEYQEQLAKLEVQSDEMKQKLRGDYLVKEKMFARAVLMYRQILKNRNPGKLGTQFYAAIWNNLGAAYAGMFRFEEAADCFLESWRLMKTKETFRKYISALPLFLSNDEYQKRLKELQSDEYLARTIQEHNAKLCETPEFLSHAEQVKTRPLDETIEELKTQYSKSTRI